MKLTDYIANFITKRTKHAFVGNGGSVVHILDSLDKHSDFSLIPFVNEQGASIAAEAYYRVTNKPGVAIATSGPGFVNLIQGIACAYYDSIPAIFITGQVVTKDLKRERKSRQVGFQEMEVVKSVKSYTKYAVCLTDSKNIKYELERLWWEAENGRPGPVVLDLPDDMARAEINPEELIGFTPPKNLQNKILNITDIEKIKKALQGSKRPLIVIGSGVKLANQEEQAIKFIQRLNIPFVTTWSTVDMFTSSFSNLIGSFGVSSNRPGNFAVQSCDLLISLGSRLDTHMTGANASKFSTKSYKIMVDIDQSEIEKENGLKIDIPININLINFFSGILNEEFTIGNISEWVNRIELWKEKYPICQPEYFNAKGYVDPYVFMDTLSKLTKKDCVIIPDAGGNLTWTMQGYEPRIKQTIFSAFNHSPMGYAFPASIGVKLARPECEVVCITGDGGLNMNLQELGTLALQKLPIKIFILNNEEYGIIKQTQTAWLDSNYVCSDVASGVACPDFLRIAQAYNIKTENINDHENLNEIMEYVMSYDDGPIICNVKIKSNQEILPKLSSGRPLEDMYPHLSEDELKLNMTF
jgi:acetolactate synthase I/II/III large subunit